MSGGPATGFLASRLSLETTAEPIEETGVVPERGAAEVDARLNFPHELTTISEVGFGDRRQEGGRDGTELAPGWP